VSGLPIKVIGCGNPDAGDDAAGLLAVRAVSQRLRDHPDVEIVEAGPAWRVGDLLHGAKAAIVVDAIRTAGAKRKPGEILRAVASPEGLLPGVGSSLSSHGLNVAEVIGIEAALGHAPHTVFLGIEAADVEMGTAPSSAVANALERLVDLIEQEVLTIDRVESPAPF
jgi:hydrogenase maturation protease